MGYYDDDMITLNKPPKRKRGYFFAGLTGAVIGGIIVLFALFFLNRGGVFSFQSNEEQPFVNNQLPRNNNENRIIQNVSVNVETDITKAVDKASDTVVGITNYVPGNFWTESQEAGTGSGVIYKKQGNTAFIVTNHHVVEGANRLEVTLPNGAKLEAKLAGSDIWTDLAVLTVDGTSINQTAEFGDSDQLKLGEPVIAIGNPLGLEFAGSITQGIISGLERTVPLDFNNDGYPDWNAEVLQTDAAINPGNSGGALVNIAGQVIGINSMKIAQQEVEGIGFSIPVNIAIPVIENLEKYGEVRRAYMGVSLQDIAEISTYHWQNTLKLPKDVTSGLMVLEVERGGPADKAGLKYMDVIVKLDDQEVQNLIGLRKHLYTKKEAGDALKVGFYRKGKYRETTLILVEDAI